MTKRKIIEIDEDRCNGCGECITACAEGALQLVNGKAKLVKADFCDGFGDCLGECPTGALKIVEREVADYDPDATRDHLARTAGPEAIRRFDETTQRHASAHGAEPGPLPSSPAPRTFAAAMGHAGCPGSRMQAFADSPGPAAATPVNSAGMPAQVNPSELRQWPVQIHLVQPGAPFFRGKELVVMNTCGPLASADVHWRFLRGRAVVVGCPKLDRTDPYGPKLAAILADTSIPKVIIVRMEVPCCGGLTAIVSRAAAESGRTDLEVEEVTLGLNGAVMGSRKLQ